ncbi:hypothetical protein PEDI_00540 [Persicobacter diffluens]|uniref:Uncharacterized protein n=1 Tax=Persicobacter diffluens TaxID=981 RepID=A0AAN5AI64_9BACT|nr:hypothetical protein PEDI_00540 [Persicobacter diffluens]
MFINRKMRFRDFTYVFVNPKPWKVLFDKNPH